jgi:hypothetical protein
MVKFIDLDGGTYVRVLSPDASGTKYGLSQEQFAYTVIKVDDRFLVQELPVYVP